MHVPVRELPASRRQQCNCLLADITARNSPTAADQHRSLLQLFGATCRGVIDLEAPLGGKGNIRPAFFRHLLESLEHVLRRPVTMRMPPAAGSTRRTLGELPAEIISARVTFKV